MSRLCIVGGADHDQQIYRDFLSLCENPAPAVGIIPCASAEPETSFSRISGKLRAAGAGPVHMIDPRTDESADLEAAERVDAVWFTGGDQALIVSCLTTKDNGDGPLLKILRERNAEGSLVLGGTSAGAAIMSRIMIYQGSSATCIHDPERGVLTGPGLGFFTDGLVDQHFDARGRLIRLCTALGRHGEARGFGIAEDTALLVDGRILRVSGRRGAYLVSRNGDGMAGRPGDWIISYLEHGDSLDLASGEFAFSDKTSMNNDEALDIPRPLASGVLSPHGDLRQFIARELLDNRPENLYRENPDLPDSPGYVKSLLLEDLGGGSYRGAQLRFYRREDSRGYYGEGGTLAFESVGFSWYPVGMQEENR
jgi:cyanophycinase